MPSERAQKRIERLLDQAEGASDQLDWSGVEQRALAILGIDPENREAIELKVMAESASRAKALMGELPVEAIPAPTTSPVSDARKPEQPGRSTQFPGETSGTEVDGRPLDETMAAEGNSAVEQAEVPSSRRRINSRDTAPELGHGFKHPQASPVATEVRIEFSSGVSVPPDRRETLLNAARSNRPALPPGTMETVRVREGDAELEVRWSRSDMGAWRGTVTRIRSAPEGAQSPAKHNSVKTFRSPTSPRPEAYQGHEIEQIAGGRWTISSHQGRFFLSLNEARADVRRCVAAQGRGGGCERGRIAAAAQLGRTSTSLPDGSWVLDPDFLLRAIPVGVITLSCTCGELGLGMKWGEHKEYLARHRLHRQVSFKTHNHWIRLRRRTARRGKNPRSQSRRGRRGQ